VRNLLSLGRDAVGKGRVMKKDPAIQFLEDQGYKDTFPKKYARVLFKVERGRIKDLIVEEFSNPKEKQYLYKEYLQDIGNCLSNWGNWTFSDVLIAIFVSYEVPASLRKKILFELSKVDEWRNDVAHWIYRNWGES
jgi:hypothetical protein